MMRHIIPYFVSSVRGLQGIRLRKYHELAAKSRRAECKRREHKRDDSLPVLHRGTLSYISMKFVRCSSDVLHHGHYFRLRTMFLDADPWRDCGIVAKKGRTLVRTPEAVEKVDLSKAPEKTLHQETLPTTFSMTFVVPPNSGYFAKNERTCSTPTPDYYNNGNREFSWTPRVYWLSCSRSEFGLLIPTRCHLYSERVAEFWCSLWRSQPRLLRQFGCGSVSRGPL